MRESVTVRRGARGSPAGPVHSHRHRRARLQRRRLAAGDSDAMHHLAWKEWPIVSSDSAVLERHIRNGMTKLKQRQPEVSEAKSTGASGPTCRPREDVHHLSAMRQTLSSFMRNMN
jgi:hypothetical protein